MTRESLPETAATPQESSSYLGEGRLSEALAAELAKPAADPETLLLFRTLDEVLGYLREKRYPQAVKLAATLQPLGGFEPEPFRAGVAVLGKSGAHLGRGEAEEALALLGHPAPPLLAAEHETQRGTAYVFLGETDTAVTAFVRATELDPKHYRALTNLGNLRLEEGRTDEAIGLYERAIHLNEGFPNAHHNLGVAYRRKGQVSKSVAAIRRAQKVSRRRDNEEARATVRSFAGTQLTGSRSRKYLKWLLYAAVAVALYLLLKAQGVL